jgi:hypothetical protein
MRRPEYQKNKQFVKFNDVLTTIMNNIGNKMNKPVQNFRDKGLDVAVWENRNGGYSFTFRKTYKNKETQQYVETKYLYKEEVEKLVELLQEAVKYASNRAAHNEEHIASGGFNKQKKAANDDQLDIDIDNLPF